MSALTTFAVLAQREAERQRGQAEALVEFMLTDLRDRLKGVGRLDVLTTVNERTLKYYADNKIEDLPPASQARYARILLAMGEDDMTRRDERASRSKFEAAAGITDRLLAASSRDPRRIWAHGQSEYWLGYHDYLWGERLAAAAHWDRRRALTRQLLVLNPRNPVYRREFGYAEGDSCALALRSRRATPGAPKEPRDAKAALQHCRAALREIALVAQASPSDRALAQDLMDRHAWLAQALTVAGDPTGAMQQRVMQERLLNVEIEADPKNLRLRKVWVVLQKEIAGLEVLTGQPEQARARLVAAKEVLDRLMAFDPENQDWVVQDERMRRAIAYFNESKLKDGGRK